MATATTITKGDIVSAAYVQSQVNALTAPATAEQTNLGLDMLDRMMTALPSQGITLPYILTKPPVATDQSGIPDYAEQAIILNLAIKILPLLGRQASVDLRADAKTSLDGLRDQEAPPVSTNPYMPIGAGGSRWAYSPVYQQGNFNVDSELGENIVTETNDPLN